MSKFFSRLNLEERADILAKTLLEAEANIEYYLMLFLSVMMATIGLFLDQATVVIGSMLIAPVMSPAISLSLGVVMPDFKIIKYSAKTLGVSMLVAFFTSAITALFIDPVLYPINNEILSRADVNMLYFLVAFVAGLAAAFSKIKDRLQATLPGVAISTALVPPLAVVGIGIARLDWLLFSKSLLLFLTNVAGICLAAILVFSLFSLHKKQD